MYEVRWRVLRERVVAVLRQAKSGDTVLFEDEIVRLAGGALALLDWHRVDGKGRCRRCRHSGRWGCLSRKQRCLVYAIFSFYLEQRAEAVWRRVQNILHAEHESPA